MKEKEAASVVVVGRGGARDQLEPQRTLGKPTEYIKGTKYIPIWINMPYITY